MSLDHFRTADGSHNRHTNRHDRGHIAGASSTMATGGRGRSERSLNPTGVRKDAIFDVEATASAASHQY
jgi:hypothetical protein